MLSWLSRTRFRNCEVWLPLATAALAAVALYKARRVVDHKRVRVGLPRAAAKTTVLVCFVGRQLSEALVGHVGVGGRRALRLTRNGGQELGGWRDGVDVACRNEREVIGVVILNGKGGGDEVLRILVRVRRVAVFRRESRALSFFASAGAQKLKSKKQRTKKQKQLACGHNTRSIIRPMAWPRLCC